MREAHAFNFLENNCAIRLEQEVLRPYKSEIKEWQYFVDSFNDTAEQEQLGYESSILIQRIRKYARSWIRNQKDKKVIELPTTKRKRPEYPQEPYKNLL